MEADTVNPHIPTPGLRPGPVPDDDRDDDALDPTAEDLVCKVLDLEAQRRLWVRTLTAVIQLRSHDSDPSSRVQLASDLMHVACCERIGRLCRSDLVDGGERP